MRHMAFITNTVLNLHPPYNFDRNAAKALVERHADGTLPEEDYNIELEDQNGQKVMFGSEADKKYLF